MWKIWRTVNKKCALILTVPSLFSKKFGHGFAGSPQTVLESSRVTTALFHS